MLVLSRQAGQTILIGDSIKLTVMDASRSKVKIGVEAPREVTVHREEVYQRIAANSTKQKIGGS